MTGITGERKEANREPVMQVNDPIDEAVAKRRTELETMSLDDIGREFESMFGIQPNLSNGKESLVERVLAKVRAELRRRA